MPSIYNWDVVAANNATADSALTWAEGQSPSTVNDSARVMMARSKELLIDIGGSLTVGGTANALTLVAQSAFTTLDNGRIVSLKAVSDNTAATTLNVNSIGSKAVVKMTELGEAPLAGAEIQAGGIYTLQYTTGLDGGSGAWLLMNPTPPLTNFKSGMGMDYWGTTAPSGWLLCYGQAVSRTDYAALFAVIGIANGAGDGSTTFNLPDKRGRVSAGKDDMGGTSANRLTGQTGGVNGDTLGGVGGEEQQTLNSTQMPVHAHGVTDPSHAHNFIRPQLVGGTGRGGNPANFDVQLVENAGTSPALTGISIKNAGGGAAHNNIQPTIICNYIIKT